MYRCSNDWRQRIYLPDSVVVIELDADRRLLFVDGADGGRRELHARHVGLRRQC